MALHTPDYVRVTIDGSDRTDYVIAYQRQSSICSFSDTFGLELNFTIPVAPEPYDAIIIRELYDGDNEKVLSGYIIDVTQSGNTGSFIINGQDKTLLLDDYFIPTQHFANGESAVYWINWYANQVDLDVQYDALNVSAFVVEEGIPMGMMTCSQGLAMLERLAAVYIKYDANIDKLLVFRINTSEPVINITNNATTRFQRELGTEKTRNKVVVYGGHQYNIFTRESTQVIATATTVLDELIVDKTVVVANPLVRRQVVANLIASRILEVVDDIDDVVNIEVAGFYPQVDVGDYAAINIGRGDFTYSGDREITSIQTSVDPNGAITVFTVGEKCPRISIMPPLSIVYATAKTGGVIISYDGGDSFEPFNAGIVSTSESDVGASGIDGLSIAANRYSQLMAIADNKLYKRVGKYGSWGEITNLGDPSNDEGLYPQSYADIDLVKVEKESGYYGRFHTLAKSADFPRWWVYWTNNFGSTWDSMQLYVPGSGIALGVASGLPLGLINGSGITQAELQGATASGAVRWSVDTLDIDGSRNSNVTVAVETSYADWVPVRQDWISDYYLLDTDLDRDDPRVFVASGTGFGDTRTWYTSGHTDLVDEYSNECDPFVKNSLWAPPNQTLVNGVREVCYALTANWVTEKYHVWRTIDGGLTWLDIHNSANTYDPLTPNPGGQVLPPAIVHWENSLNGHNIAKFGVVHYINDGLGAASGCDGGTPCGYTCNYYTSAQMSGVSNSVTIDLWEDDITYSGGAGCSHITDSYNYSMSNMGRTYFTGIGSNKTAQTSDYSYVGVGRKEHEIPIDCDSPQTTQGSNLLRIDLMTIDWNEESLDVESLFTSSEWHTAAEGGGDNKGTVNVTQISNRITVLTDVYYATGIPQAGEPYHATVRWYYDGIEYSSQEYDPEEEGSIKYLEHFNSGQLDTHFLGFKTYTGSNVIGYQVGFPYALPQIAGWSTRGYWITAGLGADLEMPSGLVPKEYAGWHSGDNKRYGDELTSYEGHPQYGPYVMRGDGHIYGFQWEDIPTSGWFFVGNAPTRSTLSVATCEMQIRRFPELIVDSSPPDPSGYAPCHLFHTNDTWGKHRILWSGIYFANGLTLFGDSYSHNLTGAHLSTISGYASFGGLVTLTRLDTTSGRLAVAGSPSGIPYSIVGPSTFCPDGKITNYLDEFSTAMGVSYVETTPASGEGVSFSGDIHWNPNYPPASGVWITVSGIGEPQNDVIGLDYPDYPRILVSSQNITNISGAEGVGIMVINVSSGATQEYRYGTFFSPEIASGICITDLEAQRIVG